MHLRSFTPLFASLSNRLGCIVAVCLIGLFIAPCAQGALLSHWSFEDSSTPATDSVGGINGHLAFSGASFENGGVTGKSLRLNKSANGFVSMGDVRPLTGTAFTIVVWLKTSPNDTSQDSFFLGKHGNGRGYTFFINRTGQLGATNKVSFYSAEGPLLTSVTSVNDGAWHQVAVVFQPGAQSQLYVDGQLERSAQLNNVQSTTHHFLLGAYNTSSIMSSFTGNLDEIQIYDRALAGPEIELLRLDPSSHLEDPTGGPLIVIPNSRDYIATLRFGFINLLPIGVIRYTTDGSDPTIQSTQYTNTVLLSNGVTQIKARLFINDFPVTEIVSATYRKIFTLPNDGISAAWREQYFGPDFAIDPRVAATADPDNDGANNLQEFVAGSDPLDPLSGFSLTTKSVPGFTWPSVANTRYRVFFATDLTTPNWTQIGEVVATGSSSSFADRRELGLKGFYKVEIVP